MMRRREFLCLLASASAATAGAALAGPLRPRLSFAQSSRGKTLIVVFQRGGCDGLNTVIPYGESRYYALRPSLAVAAPNPANPAAALPLSGFGAPTGLFGLHPALAPLLPIWQAGQLAVLPATHYPNASRSHFEGQEIVESARKPSTLDGWLNRHLVSLPRPAPLRAACLGSELAHALRGPLVVSAFDDLADFRLGFAPEQEDALLADLSRVYSQAPDDPRAYRLLIIEHGRAVVNDLTLLSGIDSAAYVPANGAQYPSTAFGGQMRQVAQLIKEDLGLEVAALSLGGWDTHFNQGAGAADGWQARRHADLAGGIAALFTDLGPRRMEDVVVLTMTEFGRTAEENGSAGTDHGHAAAWFVAGGRVRGGIYGLWPGLAGENLVNGRYLAHSVDFRDLLGDLLLNHLGNTGLAAVLPGHTYRPVGVI